MLIEVFIITYLCCVAVTFVLINAAIINELIKCIRYYMHKSKSYTLVNGNNQRVVNVSPIIKKRKYKFE